MTLLQPIPSPAAMASREDRVNGLEKHHADGVDWNLGRNSSGDPHKADNSPFGQPLSHL